MSKTEPGMAQGMRQALATELATEPPNERQSLAASIFRLSEPIPLKAGDPRVIVNGKPFMVDFRVVAEVRWQRLTKDLKDAQDDIARLERKLDAEYRNRTER
jgi:hypothetical protein